ncbi:helix-turn-helix domain-containing protein [Cystobacter fuscus]
MLVETHKTVAEIAQLVGYGDIAYFRQMFVQRAGMTPNQYRKRTTPIGSSVEQEGRARATVFKP